MKKIMRSTIISAILSCILTLMASCSNNDENTASYRKYEIPTDVMIETPDNQILTINTKDDFEKYFKNCVSSAKPDTKIRTTRSELSKIHANLHTRRINTWDSQTREFLGVNRKLQNSIHPYRPELYKCDAKMECRISYRQRG